LCRPRMDEFGEDRGGRHDHNEAASQVPDAEELQARPPRFANSPRE